MKKRLRRIPRKRLHVEAVKWEYTANYVGQLLALAVDELDALGFAPTKQEIIEKLREKLGETDTSSGQDSSGVQTTG